MDDEKNIQNTGSETSQEIALSEALTRYNELYNNVTYQNFKRAAQGLDLDFNDFIDAAIDCCRVALGDVSNGDFQKFWQQIKDCRPYVISTAHYHFLNFISAWQLQSLIDAPQETPEIQLHEVVPAFTNYEKLANALRQDMRDASVNLLVLRDFMEFTKLVYVSDDLALMAKASLQLIDSALAALDCIDHLPVLTDDDDATP